MFSITTTVTSNASGTGVIVAKGHGKQRTTHIDHAKSYEQNSAAAAGVLANVLLSSEQQAKIRHPSGAKRVRVDAPGLFGGKSRFTFDV